MKSIYAAFFALCLCFPASAQVLVTLSPSPILQFLNADATPASGGEVFIYAAGTTTKIATYIDSTGTTPNTDPIILDTRGDASIWIQPGIAYKYVLAPPGSSDPPTAPIWTVDNISIGSTSVSSTTNLQNTSRSSVPTGIILRVDYAPGNGAPPMWFTSETGNCTSNGRVNDGGSCVNATDGNSWVGKFVNGLVDISEFGAIADDSTPSDTALNSAVAYSIATNSCVFVPGRPLPFAVDSTITLSANPACIEGTLPLSYGGATTPRQGCMLHFISDTSGFFLNGTVPSVQIKNLSICGHASESLVSTKTYSIQLSHTREAIFDNLYIQDFVVDVGFSGPVSRSHFNDVRVNDQTLYPNIVNGFPRSCIEMLDSGGDTAANQYSGIECREQSFGGNPSTYTGDGSTNWFDIAIPSGGIPLWAASGINVRVGANTIQPNGHMFINAPLAKCGANTSTNDYTLWDISNAGGGGSGGTAVFCTITTASVTRHGSQITVASTTNYKSGTNILAVTTHGLPLHTTVVSIDDATHMTLSNEFAMTDAALPIEFTQTNIKNDGCGGTNCGTNMEVRFNSGSIPANTVPVNLLWFDPTGDAAIDDEGSSDYITMRPVHLGGYRVLFYHTAAVFGGVDLKPSYFEFTNQLADIEDDTYDDDLTFHYIVNPALPGAFAGAPGSYIAPWYVSPVTGPTYIKFNNVMSLYNGADAGGDQVPGYISEQWYHSEPPGTQYTTSGVAMGATDTAYCTPLVTGAPWSPKSLGVYVTSTGTTASLNEAIYATDPVTNRPGILLESTGNFTLADGWVQNPTRSSNIMSKGFFWMCTMGTWAAPPSLISVSSANGTAPASIVGSSNWEIGIPDSFSTTTAMFGNSQPVGVSYYVSGLFAAGFPETLTGLTTDVSPAITPLPATGWVSN